MSITIEALPDDDNPWVIETLTLSGVSRLHIERTADGIYRIDADESRFHIIHPAQNSAALNMSKSYSGIRHSYDSRPQDPESPMITVCKADNTGTVVVKRLTAHSYDRRIGDERFILKSPQETDRP